MTRNIANDQIGTTTYSQENQITEIPKQHIFLMYSTYSYRHRFFCLIPALQVFISLTFSEAFLPSFSTFPQLSYSYFLYHLSFEFIFCVFVSLWLSDKSTLGLLVLWFFLRGVWLWKRVVKRAWRGAQRNFWNAQLLLASPFLNEQISRDGIDTYDLRW